MALTEYQPGTAFPGVITRTADESTPAWPAPKRPPEDADRHAQHRRPVRRWSDVRQHEHHRTVLAVEVMHSQRAQPPLQSPGVSDQRVDGLPGLRWIHPLRERPPLRNPSGAGLQHVDDRGRPVRPLAYEAQMRIALAKQ